MKRKHYIAIIVAAILIKFILFCFSISYSPNSKLVNDSYRYLDTAEAMMLKGVFGTPDANGVLKPDFFIAPLYPLFLGVLHYLLNLSLNGLIFIQVLLTIATAFIVYKTAMEIDNQIAFLAFVLILYCPVITIFSLLILTETLFLFVMTLFMFFFVKYLKTFKVRYVMLAALMFSAAVYVRPGPYYLGIAIAAFVVYANIKRGIKTAIIHGLIFLGLIYGLLALWQIRNYLVFGDTGFSRILSTHAVTNGLVHSYSRDKELSIQGVSPVFYYINATWRYLVSLMTRPGSFKYLGSFPLTVAGKIFGYPWVVFWMTGFLIGLTKIRRNIYYQFLLFIIICFVSGTIIVMTFNVGERFRIPVIPFIAIISAYGWVSFRNSFITKIIFKRKQGL